MPTITAFLILVVIGLVGSPTRGLAQAPELAAFKSPGNSWSPYSNKDLDALLLAARGTFDPDARKRHYRKALALIREEAPMIFLHRQVDVYGVPKRVAWKPRSDERIWLVEAALKGDSR